MKQFHQLCFITLSSLFVIMTIATSSSSAAAFTYLIPAQIPGAKHVTATNNHHRAAVTLSNENDEEQQAEAGDEVIYRPTISDDDAASLKSRSSNRSSSPNNNRRRYTTRQRTGDLPDVHCHLFWRCLATDYALLAELLRSSNRLVLTYLQYFQSWFLFYPYVCQECTWLPSLGPCEYNVWISLMPSNQHAHR
jgi:hypothetical protein